MKTSADTSKSEIVCGHFDSHLPRLHRQLRSVIFGVWLQEKRRSTWRRRDYYVQRKAFLAFPVDGPFPSVSDGNYFQATARQINDTRYPINQRIKPLYSVADWKVSDSRDEIGIQRPALLPMIPRWYGAIFRGLASIAFPDLRY